MNDPRIPCRIPMRSVVISLTGKPVGKFAWGIDKPVGEAFRFGRHTIHRVFVTKGFQVWQGHVDEDTLRLYPKLFDT